MDMEKFSEADMDSQHAQKGGTLSRCMGLNSHDDTVVWLWFGFFTCLNILYKIIHKQKNV